MIPSPALHLYWLFAIVFGIGVYVLLASPHIIKKLIGLNLIQVSIFLVFGAAAYVDGGSPPLLTYEPPYANPLPHAIVLTAIVIGVAVTAVGLGLAVRLYAEFGTVNIDKIEEMIAENE